MHLETQSLLTVDDLAVRLKVPKSWVYSRVESGDLPHRKIGRYVRFVAEEIDDYLEAARRGPRRDGRGDG